MPLKYLLLFIYLTLQASTKNLKIHMQKAQFVFLSRILIV